ncbi:UNVERIFIED_CONTAM: hypothetical protein FKN15_002136 [Acipenser sinensis]
MADASCQEEVGGDLQQPEEVLLVRGKESLQQQIQTLHKDESREARKQRMAEQIRLVERRTLLSHLWKQPQEELLRKKKQFPAQKTEPEQLPAQKPE